LQTILRSGLSRGRKLDRGNAQPGALGSDFATLGLVLWPALKAADSRASKWQSELETLNIARNAIAHDDQDEFNKLRHAGKTSINLSTVRTWRRALDGLATTMDDVVGDYLSTFAGGQRPW
jgi:hypothetical protein